MGTLKENGDLLGTQKLKKVPMGTRVPKWGPTWEQWERQREKALGGGLRTVWRLYVHLYSVYYTKNLNMSEN